MRLKLIFFKINLGKLNTQRIFDVSLEYVHKLICNLFCVLKCIFLYDEGGEKTKKKLSLLFIISRKLNYDFGSPCIKMWGARVEEGVSDNVTVINDMS